MKIDILQKIKGVDGIKALPNLDTELDLTLKDVIIQALLSFARDEPEKEKFDSYRLYERLKVHSKNEINLTTEELAKIKKKIGSHYAPLIMGQAWDMIEKK